LIGCLFFFFFFFFFFASKDPEIAQRKCDGGQTVDTGWVLGSILFL